MTFIESPLESVLEASAKTLDIATEYISEYAGEIIPGKSENINE